MELVIPTEPVVLRFNPTKSDFLLPAFIDDIAWELYLLMAPVHLVDKDFPAWCLEKAEIIRQKKPATPRELFQILRTRNLEDVYLSDNLEDCEDFLNRLLMAFNGDPIRYEVKEGEGEH